MCEPMPRPETNNQILGAVPVRREEFEDKGLADRGVKYWVNDVLTAIVTNNTDIHDVCYVRLLGRSTCFYGKRGRPALDQAIEWVEQQLGIAGDHV